MANTKNAEIKRAQAVASNDGLCGASLIALERQRQISKEGWTPEHDDSHDCGEMGVAAECYIRQARGRRWMVQRKYRKDTMPDDWPWEPFSWKPKSPIKDLVKAGALIAAEIDRLQRIEAKAT